MSNRQLRTLMVGSALLFVLAVLSSGCGAPIDAARNSLATAAKVEAEAVQAFTMFDRTHQMDIVAEASSGAEANANLASYRKERVKVVTAVQSLWLATVAAETAIDEAESGLRSKSDIAGYVAALLKNVNALKDALVALGVPLGGL